MLVAGTTTGKIHVCAMVADVLKPMPTKLEGHTGQVSSIFLSDGGSTVRAMPESSAADYVGQVWSGGADSTVSSTQPQLANSQSHDSSLEFSWHRCACGELRESPVII